MVDTILPALVMLLGLAVALAGVAWRARRWLAGRPADVEGIRGLLRVPHRYLVHVHEAVARDPIGGRARRDTGSRTAILHVLTAGGFTAATLLIIPVHGLQAGGTMFAFLLLAALCAMLAGTMMEVSRRLRAPRPSRLSTGAFDRLPWGLMAFVAYFAFVTLSEVGVAVSSQPTSMLGIVLLALGLYGSIELYAGLALGPMKHALNGGLHLAFHERPARFDGARPDTDLHPQDLDAARLGVATPRDFTWPQLLGFDACVECGRCEAACPAFEAGLPLNPKKLVQDLVAAQAHTASDAGYGGRSHPGRPIGDAHGGRDAPLIGEKAMIHPDTLWACTTCRACVYECPMMIEHVDAVIDMRRYETLERGATPGKGAEVLEELRATDNLGGRAPEQRVEWASDLRLPHLEERGECEVLLWLGEGAFDMRHQRTLRALVRLLRRADVDFAVLGERERDCGHVARVLGDEATFQDLQRRNLETLSAWRFERIVTADPHVLHTLRNEYPGLAERCEILHHSTYLAWLVEGGRLEPASTTSSTKVTFHDPCYLSRANGEVEAPRTLLSAMGVEVTEMEKCGKRTSCCGWGGGAAYTDIPGDRRIPDVRMDHARGTGARTVAVGCPNCTTMLEGVVEPRPDVRDIAELLLDSVEGTR